MQNDHLIGAGDMTVPVMTPEEFKTRMLAEFPATGYDEEYAHARADGLMCELLKSLGYGEGVAIFIASDKWYA